MSINETKLKVREKYPLAFDLEGVPKDTPEDRKERNRLLKEFQEEGEQMPNQQWGSGVNDNIFDMSAKVTKPYAHQEYPKMMYSEKFDPDLDKRIEVIKKHNATLRDPLQMRDLPARQQLTLVVHNKKDEDKAVKDGFGLKPPAPIKVEEPVFG